MNKSNINKQQQQQQQTEPRFGRPSRSYSCDDDESTASAASAGLFVDRSGSKPLPLSGNRFVVPSLPFKKKATFTTNTATILRKTGNKPAFSDSGKELSGDEDNVSDAWICAHCGSKNHTRNKSACTICGNICTPQDRKAPIATKREPRRGRRHEAQPEQPPQLQTPSTESPSSSIQPQVPSSLPSQRPGMIERSRTTPDAMRPTGNQPQHQQYQHPQHNQQPLPPAPVQHYPTQQHQQQQQVHSQQQYMPSPQTNHASPSNAPGATVVPMNPFDGLSENNDYYHRPVQQMLAPTESFEKLIISRENSGVQTPDSPPTIGVRVETVDSSEEGEHEMMTVMGTPPHHYSTTTIASPSGQSNYDVIQSSSHSSKVNRSSSPAFSTSTSVDTPVRSNRATAQFQDPFAPYQPQPHANNHQHRILQPIESTDDIESQPQLPFPDKGQDSVQRNNGGNQVNLKPFIFSATLNAPQPQGDFLEEEEPRQRFSRQSSNSDFLAAERSLEYPPQIPTLNVPPRPPPAFPKPFSHQQQQQPPQPRETPPAGPFITNNFSGDTPQSPGGRSSAMETLAGDEEEDVGEQEEDQQTKRALVQGDRSRELCRSVVFFAIGIVLLLAVGGLVVYFVVADNGGSSEDSSRDVPTKNNIFSTRPPTLSPTAEVRSTTSSPSLVLIEDETSLPTLVPTEPTEAPTMTPSMLATLPPLSPWVLDSSRVGAVNRTRLGKMTAVSANGNRIVVSDESGTIYTFNADFAPVGEPLIVSSNSTILSFDINGNCTRLAIGMNDGSLLMYLFDEDASEWFFEGALRILNETVNVMTLSMSEKGDRLAVGVLASDESTPVQLWAIQNSTWTYMYQSVREGTFDGLHVDLSPDGTMLAVARRQYVGFSLLIGYVSILRVRSFEDGSIFLFDAGFISTGRSSAHVSISNIRNGVASLAISGVDGRRGNWDLYTSVTGSTQWTNSLEGDEGARVTSAFLSRNADRIALVDAQGQIFTLQKVFSGISFQWETVEVPLEPIADGTRSVVFSLDGNAIVVGTPDYSPTSGEYVEEGGIIEIYRRQ